MKEVTYEDWQKNPTPREMWCWNSSEDYKVKARVIHILSDGISVYPIVSVTDDDSCYETFQHCAEIKKSRQMTNKELAWWLSEEPHRELKMGDYIYHDYDYKENEQDAEVEDLILIRESDSEWREPLVEV